MKTQILHLEQHDDINSTRDKMGWGQTTRTLLVWPPGSKILQRRLDLVLLLRHSQSMGSQLALVTDNNEVRFQANDLGIPVFNSTQEAQDIRWRTSRRMKNLSPPDSGEIDGAAPGNLSHSDLSHLREAAHPEPPLWRKNSWVRLGVFAVGVSAILAIASMFIPGAEINVIPGTETQEIQFTVQSSNEVDSITPAGVVPAREISVVVEGRDSLASSGQIQLQNTASRGNVRFTNLTDQEISVPMGTIIRTLGPDPVRFSTQEVGSVPDGAGNTIILPVTALTRGTIGNLPSNRLVAIEGALGLSLAASNPFPTHGGTDVASPAPTSSDRQRLYNRLLNSLMLTASDEIEGSLKTGEYLISIQPELIEVHQEAYTPDAAEAADNLDLHLQAEFRGLAIPSDMIQLLASSILDARLPDGFSSVGNSPQIENLSEPVQGVNGISSWEVHSERQIIAQIDGAQVAELTRGQTPLDAQMRLQESLSLDALPEIKLAPVWWPRLPYLPFRIRVNFEEGLEAIASGYARPGR